MGLNGPDYVPRDLPKWGDFGIRSTTPPPPGTSQAQSITATHYSRRRQSLGSHSPRHSYPGPPTLVKSSSSHSGAPKVNIYASPMSRSRATLQPSPQNKHRTFATNAAPQAQAGEGSQDRSETEHLASAIQNFLSAGAAPSGIQKGQSVNTTEATSEGVVSNLQRSQSPVNARGTPKSASRPLPQPSFVVSSGSVATRLGRDPSREALYSAAHLETMDARTRRIQDQSERLMQWPCVEAVSAIASTSDVLAIHRNP